MVECSLTLDQLSKSLPHRITQLQLKAKIKLEKAVVTNLHLCQV